MRPPAMRGAPVSLGDRSYPIQVGNGLLAGNEALARLAAGRRVAIVTDSNVAALHARTVADTPRPHAASLLEVVLAAGESTKTW
jgi:3-dehydroquinate synthase